MWNLGNRYTSAGVLTNKKLIQASGGGRGRRTDLPGAQGSPAFYPDVVQMEDGMTL